MSDKMNNHITHKATIKLPDGSTADHIAEAIRYRHVADGAVAVLARCCGDSSTDSWHSFYDVAKMSDEDITKEVQEHVQRKAEHHAAVHRSEGFIRTLLKGDTADIQGAK